MVDISGKSYIILGIFVAAVSGFVHFGTERNFIVFIILGIIGIVFGIVKSFAGKKPVQHKPYPHPSQVKYCPACRNMTRATDVFCSKCGNRL